MIWLFCIYIIQEIEIVLDMYDITKNGCTDALICKFVESYKISYLITYLRKNHRKTRRDLIQFFLMGQIGVSGLLY